MSHIHMYKAPKITPDNYVQYKILYDIFRQTHFCTVILTPNNSKYFWQFCCRQTKFCCRQTKFCSCTTTGSIQHETLCVPIRIHPSHAPRLNLVYLRCCQHHFSKGQNDYKIQLNVLFVLQYTPVTLSYMISCKNTFGVKRPSQVKQSHT